MRLIDTFPTDRIGDFEYRIGRIFPFGATLDGDGGVNFSIYSKEATGCTLVLYRHGQKKPLVEIPFPESFRIGNVYTMRVYGINMDTMEYGYRFDGQYAPKEGLWFDKNRVLLDPYAKSVSGRSVWGKKKKKDEQVPFRGQIIREDYTWNGDKPLERELQDLVIYEMHVRSFTQHKSSGVKHRGTYAGMVEKIPYLKELGVNCVELMPIFEFDELEGSRKYNGKELVNLWGYSTTCFFAPKAGYAASAPFGMEVDELKNLIKKLHSNGIEVILDVVFNHTAEGNENGPSISYRGIDNRTYYLLTPEWHYLNFSGCGNTMNCNNPVVRNMVIDCLRYWVSAYHVDGFRFDLAAILSRDENGAPMIHPPLLDSIAQDAVLGKSIIIAEAWDAGGLYQVGSFPGHKRWSEWNGRYRDCLRRFIKGGAECAPELFQRIKGSEDLYGERGASTTINFVTCHDGFTLNDLVSYNEKHNESNGEDNNDGCNDNDSWNCGVEGETDDPEILSLRQRQMKNMLNILLTSRGVPMLLSGDEFANSQSGNNNAYCQDNEISWLNWGDLSKNKCQYDYVRRLIAFRMAHPVLRATDYNFSHNGTGYPELSFHGLGAWNLDQYAPTLTFGYMYAEDHEKYGTKEDCFIYVAVNAHWEWHSFELPIIPEGMKWGIAFESSGISFDEGSENFEIDQSVLNLGPRSSAILVGRNPGRKKTKK
ncbi:glycogen debranching protein GlgX [Butyrivibrio sp. AE2032]|uniref:glycogen debranching protein GlgX n=1 Tax=Butyrivibrio sp. AE2032 TaxID=1458463 RepID=UPI00055958CB|nr:glycogen debranching protein GlgX [Butyrivibrio sp. AE2032]